jgi:hypothetical protein
MNCLMNRDLVEVVGDDAPANVTRQSSHPM